MRETLHETFSYTVILDQDQKNRITSVLIPIPNLYTGVGLQYNFALEVTTFAPDHLPQA